MPVLVQPEGEKHAKFVIVGEAPGISEVREGRPFVGPSGELLNACLRSAGILRSDCYVTNIVKERPPNNDISSFCIPGKFNSPDFIAYRDALAEELSTTTANIIIALGATALYALTGKESILKNRGSILPSTLVPGRKVIGCIHPAAALREYMLRYYIIQDFIKAEKESKFKEIKPPPYEILLQPTFTDAMAYLKSLRGKGKVGVDIEVVNEQIDCIALATKNRVMCIPFMVQSDEYFNVEQETQLWQEIASILEDPSYKKVFQNGAFDVSFLHRRYGIRTTVPDDTMIAQGLYVPDLRKDLGTLVSLYTDQPFYKDDGKKHKSSGSNATAWWRYNALDAVVLLDIIELQLQELSKLQLLNVYQSHCDLIPILSFLQSYGVSVDKAGLEEESIRAGEEIKTIETEVQKIVGHPINIRSPLQLKKYFYEERGAKPISKNGKITTDEKALRRLASKGFAEASLMLRHRELSKLKGTYFDVKISDDSRLRSSYNPIGTSTGRLSSSADIFDEGTNMQNLPKTMLKYLRIDPGYLGIMLDKAGAESRIVAYMGPVPKMIEAFEQGIDMHRRTAAMIFGVPYAEVSTEKYSGKIGHSDKSQRDWGKTMNHSSNYGIGPNTFAARFEIPLDMAKRLLQRYHLEYPEVENGYQEQIKRMLYDNRLVRNCMDRTRLFLDRIGPEIYQDAFAFPPQSTIADEINRKGLIYIWNHPELQDVCILNQVHDAIYFQLPRTLPLIDIARKVSIIIKELQTPLRWKGNEFSIPVDMKISTTTFYDTKDVVRVTPEPEMLKVALESALG